MAIAPLLEARNMMRKQKAVLDRQLAQMARADAVCKRLMTVSGVGPIVSQRGTTTSNPSTAACTTNFRATACSSASINPATPPPNAC